MLVHVQIVSQRGYSCLEKTWGASLITCAPRVEKQTFDSASVIARGGEPRLQISLRTSVQQHTVWESLYWRLGWAGRDLPSRQISTQPHSFLWGGSRKLFNASSALHRQLTTPTSSSADHAFSGRFRMLYLSRFLLGFTVPDAAALPPASRQTFSSHVSDIQFLLSGPRASERSSSSSSSIRHFRSH